MITAMDMQFATSTYMSFMYLGFSYGVGMSIAISFTFALSALFWSPLEMVFSYWRRKYGEPWERH